MNVGPREHAALVDVDAIEPLHYADICAAFGFKCLKHLSIEHPAPIDLSPKDILQVARRSKHLESLWLNPEPALQDMAGYEKPLPMESLRAFAKYCASMKRLGLYLSGKPSFVTWNLFHNFRSQEFMQLEELQMGESPVAFLPHSSRHSNASLDKHLLKDRQRCMNDWITIASILAEVLSPKTTVTTALDSYLDSFRGSFRRITPMVIWRDVASYPKAEMRRSWHAIHALSHFLRQYRAMMERRDQEDDTVHELKQINQALRVIED